MMKNGELIPLHLSKDHEAKEKIEEDDQYLAKRYALARNYVTMTYFTKHTSQLADKARRDETFKQLPTYESHLRELAEQLAPDAGHADYILRKMPPLLLEKIEKAIAELNQHQKMVHQMSKRPERISAIEKILKKLRPYHSPGHMWLE